MNKRCTNCGKFPFCKNIKEQEKYGYGHQIDEESWLKLLSILEKDLLEKGAEE